MRVRALLAALLAVGAVAASVAFAGPTQAAFGREFRARARAFPVEPDPGQNQISFAFRPVAVEGGIASTPTGANGRAAILDLGFIENQVPPPQDSFARCDTVSPNVPDDEERIAGSIRLAAHCAEGPTLSARADGVSPAAILPPEALAPLGISGGLVSSRATADGSGPTVAASAVSEVTDLGVGPLHVEEIRFRARVEANGEPGGAAAEWSVDAMAATVGGVPVIIGTNGVQVDEQAVPVPLLSQATAAVQQAFAQSGGYVDVRILEPQRSAAEDGSSAEVMGGGLHIFLASSPDPTDREFLGITLLGGHVEVDVGGQRRGPLDLSPFTSGAARVGGALSARPELPTAARAPRAASPAVQSAAAPAQPEPAKVSLATATARRSLAQPSSWWIAALVGGAALLALAAASSTGPLLPVRRRVGVWWNVTAERFLRG